MTIDKAQLKALAEAAMHPQRTIHDEHDLLYRFQHACYPAEILALLAEIDRLEREARNDAIAYRAAIEKQEEIRAELAGLRTGYDAQNEVIAELRKDAERYNWAICRVQCAEALSAVVICHDGYKEKINERVDAYMEAWPCPVAAMAKEASHG